MSILYRYFLIAIAGASLLLGIQIPNFVDQYEKRLDAHMIEVTENLRGFQELADKYYLGSLEALIREHEKSGTLPFSEETKPLKAMVDRYRSFQDEQAALKTSLAGKVAHILFRGDRALLNETYSNYSFNIPLNGNAVISGALFMALALVLVETIVKLLAWAFALNARSSGRAKRFG